MPTKYQVVSNPVAPVGAHSWNGDRTQVAVSPNNHLVHIYAFKAGGFELLHTLDNHTEREWRVLVSLVDSAARSFSALGVVVVGVDVVVVVAQPIVTGLPPLPASYPSPSFHPFAPFVQVLPASTGPQRPTAL